MRKKGPKKIKEGKREKKKNFLLLILRKHRKKISDGTKIKNILNLEK